ncbi:DUF805 domain-containing protein [Aeromonas taiwanensis]|uniref:DUF805 domain-containing protein n=1 Tax=Aeromonas taiwanensis TaxID=633417 RepID=UPI0005C24B7E|nr:DUF805 domain-containing protein [Aeromonas taiwanensis]
MLSRLFTGLMNKRLQRRGYIGYMLLLFFIVLSALMTTLGTGTLAYDFIASNIAKMAMPLIAGMVALFLLVGYANINLAVMRARDIGLRGGYLFLFSVVFLISTCTPILSEALHGKDLFNGLHGLLVLFLAVMPSGLFKKTPRQS